MEKDDTTQLKTKHTRPKPSGDMDESKTARIKNSQSSVSESTLSATERLLDDDLLSNSPTLSHYISKDATGEKDSVFSRLDRRVAEEYASSRVLKQRFVLTKILGSGGMGNVYLAKDLLREELEDSSPHVAIKVLNDSCRELPGALQALQSEAKKTQTLSHPNIVTVYDFDRDGGTAFITMEYISGESLKDLVRTTGLPQIKALHVIDRVARGLAYAHQQGFVHADIKPANIFCGDNGAVKILDFGIAKAFTEAAMETRSLGDKLTEGALTPAYASLQTLEGLAPHPSDDVYALACMAYELLQGRHPFIGDRGRGVSALFAKEHNLKVKPIPGVSRRVMNALRKGLAFERKDRFIDAGDFIDAIKPRSFKKEAILLAVAALLTAIIMFSGSKALDKVVPSIDSLKPELLEVGNTIKEADEFIDTQDIDFAHRLYSQAWALAGELTKTDVDERDKARAILSDRMGKISTILIERLSTEQLDEYQLRELLVAFEFMLQDGITDNTHEIELAIQTINSNLHNLDAKKMESK